MIIALFKNSVFLLFVRVCSFVTLILQVFIFPLAIKRLILPHSGCRKL